jgi:hypothetical protein
VVETRSFTLEKLRLPPREIDEEGRAYYQQREIVSLLQSIAYQRQRGSRRGSMKGTNATTPLSDPLDACPIFKLILRLPLHGVSMEQASHLLLEYRYLVRISGGNGGLRRRLGGPAGRPLVVLGPSITQAAQILLVFDSSMQILGGKCAP